MKPLGTINTRMADGSTNLVSYYETFTLVDELWAVTDLNNFTSDYTVTHVRSGTRVSVQGYSIENVIANAKTTIITKGEKAIKEQLKKHKPLNEIKIEVEV